jgi:ATP-dependent RNA helicase DBP3
VDLAEDGCVDLSKCKYLVLDEADRMLDMGFEPQIKRIVAMLPETRQTLMFSATWPPDVRKMAETYLSDPWQISIGEKVDKLSANKSVEQVIKVAEERERWPLLQQTLTKWCGGPGKEGSTRIMLFMLYKKSCQRMNDNLYQAGWNCACVHGDMAQAGRNKAVEEFKSGKTNILVCTDVAARGLDIKGVNYVINYEFPLLCEDWVHRVGRTGRAGMKGLALTYFGFEDRKHSRELNHILESSGATVPKDFKELVDKSPPWIKRKTNAERMFGRGGGGDDSRPMKKASHVTF